MSTIKNADQFVTWLNGLALAKAPKFRTDEEKLQHALIWRDALKDVTAAEFELLRGSLLGCLKFYPSPAVVLELLSAIVKVPFFDAEQPGENPNQISQWKGQDIFPGCVIATPAQKAAIEKHLGHTSPLPTLNRITGDIDYRGKKIGNIVEYAHVKKEKNKHV